LTVVEVDKMVELGELDPESGGYTEHFLVDRVVVYRSK